LTPLTTDKPKHGCFFNSIRTSFFKFFTGRGGAASGGGFWHERLAPAIVTVIPLALACLLAGCTVGPDYLKPDVTLNPFHNAEAVTGHTAEKPAPPLDQWWLGFNDPELTKIIQRALAQNLISKLPSNGYCRPVRQPERQAPDFCRPLTRRRSCWPSASRWKVPSVPLPRLYLATTATVISTMLEPQPPGRSICSGGSGVAKKRPKPRPMPPKQCNWVSGFRLRRMPPTPIYRFAASRPGLGLSRI